MEMLISFLPLAFKSNGQCSKLNIPSENGLWVVLVFLCSALSFVGPFADDSTARNQKFDTIFLKHNGL